MKRTIAVIGLALLFWTSEAFAKKNVSLMPGIGVKGGVKIGDSRREKKSSLRTWKQEIIDKSDDISYMTNSRNEVALIRCDKPSCLTDDGIRVGMDRSEILKRHGAPKKQHEIQTGEYYEYEGVGFELDRQGRVTSILIFPR